MYREIERTITVGIDGDIDGGLDGGLDGGRVGRDRWGEDTSKPTEILKFEFLS